MAGFSTLTERTQGHLTSRTGSEKSMVKEGAKDPYGLDAIDAME